MQPPVISLAQSRLAKTKKQAPTFGQARANLRHTADKVQFGAADGNQKFTIADFTEDELKRITGLTRREINKKFDTNWDELADEELQEVLGEKFTRKGLEERFGVPFSQITNDHLAEITGLGRKELEEISGVPLEELKGLKLLKEQMDDLGRELTHHHFSTYDKFNLGFAWLISATSLMAGLDGLALNTGNKLHAQSNADVAAITCVRDAERQ